MTFYSSIFTVCLFFSFSPSLYHHLSEEKSMLLKASISTEVPVDDEQGWEEITAASLVHLINTLQKKSGHAVDAACEWCGWERGGGEVVFYLNITLCFSVPSVLPTLELPENIEGLKRLILQLHELLQR